MAQTNTAGFTPELFNAYHAFEGMLAKAGFQTAPLTKLMSGWLIDGPQTASTTTAAGSNAGQQRRRNRNASGRNRSNSATAQPGNRQQKIIAAINDLGGQATAAQIAEHTGLKALGPTLGSMPELPKDGLYWTLRGAGTVSEIGRKTGAARKSPAASEARTGTDG